MTDLRVWTNYNLEAPRYGVLLSEDRFFNYDHIDRNWPAVTIVAAGWRDGASTVPKVWPVGFPDWRRGLPALEGCVRWCSPLEMLAMEA